MIEYFAKYHAKLLTALLEHIEIVLICLFFSLILATILTMLCIYSKVASKCLTSLFAVIYAIPSLAMFAMLIPVTGLGKTTAILVLTLYNQYLLLHNFIAGIDGVDPAIIDAAVGMGMTKMQVLIKVQIPLSRKALFAGVRIAIISTIGIATIAACINAGGLGTILFDGLRTMNIIKILWGSILVTALAIVLDTILKLIENKIGDTSKGGK